MRPRLLPADSLDGRCHCLAARKAARYLSAAYDKALAAADLRATQFTALSKLASQGPMAVKWLSSPIAGPHDARDQSQTRIVQELQHIRATARS